MHHPFPLHPPRQRAAPTFPIHPSHKVKHARNAAPQPASSAPPPRMGREDQLRRAATQAQTYSNTYRWTDGNEEEHSEPTEAPAAVEGASKILGVMTELVRSKRPMFTRTRKFMGRPLTVCTPIGRAFVDLLETFAQEEFIRPEFPEHAFHPLVELFWKHTAPLHPRGKPYPGEAELIEECVAAIRREASSDAFRALRKKHGKTVRENTESLLDYIDDLFVLWGRLLVIRLDIGLRALRGRGQAEPEVTAEEFSRQRRKLFRFMRSNKFPATLRGYAWSLGKGRRASWHGHLLLFVDGGTSCHDVLLARMIGQHWQDVVTGGKGRYYNCNAKSYPERGVGMVHHWDRRKLDILKVKVASYLTKADYLLRVVLTKGKAFSHGRVKRADSKGGRPRSRGPVWH